MKNKIDIGEYSILQRQFEVFHQQLESTLMVLVQHFKEIVKGETVESLNCKKERDVNFLNKMLIICNWVQNDTPQNINQGFESVALSRKSSIFSELKDKIDSDLKDHESLKLSPSNQQVNQQVKRQFQRMNI